MNNYKYENLDIREINYVINKCDICILGLSNNDIPYLVPVYFIYDKEERKFYLESKAFGRKMKTLGNNQNAVIYIQYDEQNCYKTLIAEGTVEITKPPKDCNCSNMVSIILTVHELSGRLYKK